MSALEERFLNYRFKLNISERPNAKLAQHGVHQTPQTCLLVLSAAWFPRVLRSKAFRYRRRCKRFALSERLRFSCVEPEHQRHGFRGNSNGNSNDIKYHQIIFCWVFFGRKPSCTNHSPSPKPQGVYHLYTTWSHVCVCVRVTFMYNMLIIYVNITTNITYKIQSIDTLLTMRVLQCTSVW